MIIGTGVDIVQIPRVARLFTLYGQLFVKRILSQDEIKAFTSLNKELYHNFLAKRFAAKEAVAKAFGSGMGCGLSFKDISTINGELGKPFVKISSLQFHDKFKQFQIHLSISDDYPTAIAFAVVSKL